MSIQVHAALKFNRNRIGPPKISGNPKALALSVTCSRAPLFAFLTRPRDERVAAGGENERAERELEFSRARAPQLIAFSHSIRAVSAIQSRVSLVAFFVEKLQHCSPSSVV